MIKKPAPAIVWFRQDLRLADNPALHGAIAAGGPVLPVYVLDEAAQGGWQPGAASRWWLHGSLASLAHDLAAKGAPLVLRRGDAASIIPALADETGAPAVHVALAHEPGWRAVDKAVSDTLKKSGKTLVRHRGANLIDPFAVRTGTGGVYGMYTPFARAVLAAGDFRAPLPIPAKIHGAKNIASDRLEDWALLPKNPDWAGGLRKTWSPGEAAARAALGRFLDNAVCRYATGRNLPGEDGTSCLSPHLHFGEISPHTVWHATQSVPPGEDRRVFLSELLWREFSAYLLWHHPTMPDAPLRQNFENLPWRDDPANLAAWQRGQTGVPIVDAGMRQLWQTGWMHNRVRMITASYLIKHLLISWRAGESWFWDTLVDADLAANSASWQWVAGTGIDSQPFFRVFNPVTQAEKFDAAGAYIRQYVPELARLPGKFVHAPWSAPADVLTGAGVILGQTYPKPLVDLAEGRARALAAYKSAVRAEAA